MLNTLILVSIEQLTIIFIEQWVFFIPFENSDNLERSLVPQGGSQKSKRQKPIILGFLAVMK